MSVVIEMSEEAKAVMREAQDFGPRLLRRVARTMDKFNADTAGHIGGQRMSGPRSATVLGAVRGHLRRSVRANKTVIEGNALASSIGSNIVYMGVHEFGFQGTVQVKAHQRRFARFEGQAISLRDAKSIRGKAMKKKLRTGVQNVRAHSRHMNIPMRAPIYNGIVDRLPLMSEVISQAVVDEWQRRPE